MSQTASKNTQGYVVVTPAGEPFMLSFSRTAEDAISAYVGSYNAVFMTPQTWTQLEARGFYVTHCSFTVEQRDGGGK